MPTEEALRQQRWKSRREAQAVELRRRLLWIQKDTRSRATKIKAIDARLVQLGKNLREVVRLIHSTRRNQEPNLPRTEAGREVLIARYKRAITDWRGLINEQQRARSRELATQKTAASEYADKKDELGRVIRALRTGAPGGYD